MEGQISLGVDAQIIHVDLEPSFCNHISEYVIHKHLESGWCIAKAKEHDRGFEEAIGSNESCFPLVHFTDTNVVVPPSNVEFGEQGSLSCHQ